MAGSVDAEAFTQVESVIVGSSKIPAACSWPINLVRLANVVPLLLIFKLTLCVLPTVLHQNSIVSAIRSLFATNVAVPGASSQYGSQPVITGNAGIAVGVSTSVIGVISSLAPTGLTTKAAIAIVSNRASGSFSCFMLVLICYKSLDTADRLEIFVDLDLVPKLFRRAQSLVYR